MQINPYLNFNGNCAEAFKFYEQVLGSKILFSMTWGEMPGADQFPAETHGRIMHINLKVGEQSVMGADAPADSYHAPKGMNVSIHIKDQAEAERVFNALAERGNVQMPFAQTFWSPGF